MQLPKIARLIALSTLSVFLVVSNGSFHAVFAVPSPSKVMQALKWLERGRKVIQEGGKIAAATVVVYTTNQYAEKHRRNKLLSDVDLLERQYTKDNHEAIPITDDTVSAVMEYTHALEQDRQLVKAHMGGYLGCNRLNRLVHKCT